MPRFSLGSRQNSDNTQSPFRLRFQLQKDRLQTWWRHLLHPNNSAASVSNHSSTGNNNNSNTRDWRSLSPNEPPLPFIASLTESSPNHGTNTSLIHTRNIRPLDSNNNNNSSSSNAGGRFSKGFARAIRIAPQTNGATREAQQYFPRQSAGSIDDRTARALYTILEESDTIMTDSSQSTTPRNRPSSYQEKRISIGSFGSGDGVAAGPGLPDDAVHSGTSSTSSAVSYQPPSSLWPCTPNGKREPQFRQSIIGDENKCRRKFAKMVQAAQQFQSEHKAAHDIPKEMEIVFNGQDNVQYIRLVLNGQSEYHKFCGNSQYIPPELMTTGTYNSNGLADVWVLGISLYRMLVGKFPFIASSDRKLFKKMLHADFSIPHSLSEDAQDLLRRMLAPESSRASLDLVMFHPWLKSYMATTTMVSDLQRPNQRLQKEQPQKQSNATDVDNHATIPSSSSGFVPETSLLSPPSSPPPPPRPTAAAAAEHDTLANAPRKPSTRDRSSKRMSRTLADMLLILVEGPFPPPKHPYRELAYLGADRREEIAAAL